VVKLGVLGAENYRYKILEVSTGWEMLKVYLSPQLTRTSSPDGIRGKPQPKPKFGSFSNRPSES